MFAITRCAFVLVVSSVINAVYCVVKSATLVMLEGIPEISAFSASLFPAQMKIVVGFAFTANVACEYACPNPSPGNPSTSCVICSCPAVGEATGTVFKMSFRSAPGTARSVTCDEGLSLPVVVPLAVTIVSGLTDFSTSVLGAPGGAISACVIPNPACAATSGAHPCTSAVSSSDPL